MILLNYFYFGLLEVFRTPMYVLASFIFPSMFFLFFAVPNVSGVEEARALTTAFATFAVLGVLFFEFGVGWAQERTSSWARYQKGLPVSPGVAIFARLLVSYMMAIPAASLVFITGFISTELDFSFLDMARILGALLITGAPFALSGYLLGTLCSAKAALPVGNLLYLPLSFAGGLWIPPNGLPSLVQTYSVYLPTRFYGEVAWAAEAGEWPPLWSLVGLSVFTLALVIFLTVYARLRPRWAQS